MQDIRNAFEIKRPATQNNLVFIGCYIKTSQKPQPEKYNRYAQKKKKESNVTKIKSASHEQGGREEKTSTKTNPKQLTKGQQLEHRCCCLVTKSCLTLLPPHGLQSTRLLYAWDFPGKNTGADCHFLLQGSFPTQGLNLGVLHRQADSLTLSPQGNK